MYTQGRWKDTEYQQPALGTHHNDDTVAYAHLNWVICRVEVGVWFDLHY